MARHENRYECGCPLASLEGHAARVSGSTVGETLPGLIKGARKEHVPPAPGVDWDQYRDLVADAFATLVREVEPRWTSDTVLDLAQARALVLLVHGRSSISLITSALSAASAS